MWFLLTELTYANANLPFLLTDPQLAPLSNGSRVLIHILTALITLQPTNNQQQPHFTTWRCGRAHLTRGPTGLLHITSPRSGWSTRGTELSAGGTAEQPVRMQCILQDTVHMLNQWPVYTDLSPVEKKHGSRNQGTWAGLAPLITTWESFASHSCISELCSLAGSGSLRGINLLLDTARVPLNFQPYLPPGNFVHLTPRDWKARRRSPPHLWCSRSWELGFGGLQNVEDDGSHGLGLKKKKERKGDNPFVFKVHQIRRGQHFLPGSSSLL